jgi:hypothetical protein
MESLQRISELMAKALPPESMRRLNEQMAIALPPENVRRISEEIVKALPPENVRRVSEQMAMALPPENVQRLTEQITRAYPVDELQGLTEKITRAYAVGDFQQLTAQIASAYQASSLGGFPSSVDLRVAGERLETEVADAGGDPRQPLGAWLASRSLVVQATLLYAGLQVLDAVTKLIEEASGERSLSSSVRQVGREFSERPPRCRRVC